jgi:phosphoribosylformimino-5-aminoimidazole carboxamide ribotide isomerase
MKFRPCIDLHGGVVKQIVGSTLSEKDDNTLITNYASDRPASWYADAYRKDRLTGGHVIRLGPGNDEAAKEAMSAWPGGLHLGGGVDISNAGQWLEWGAEKVIVTSYIFSEGQVHQDRLQELSESIGANKLVLDLSCRKKDGRYWIVTDRWQNFTQVEVDASSLDYFSAHCSEFLIHGVDVEGKSGGIESELVERLGNWGKMPITYAGGVRSWEDIRRINELGAKKIDFTVGSALDIFGGTGLKYVELVEKNGIGFKNI